MNKEEKTIEIPLEEYKELLEIKGSYEELKNKRNDIIYIPYKISEPQPYRYPNITWGTGSISGVTNKDANGIYNYNTSSNNGCTGCTTRCEKHGQN